MWELIGVVAILVVVYYVSGIDVLLHEATHPPEPYPDQDKALKKTVVVTHEFDSPGTRSIRAGKVELNGTIWLAQTEDDSHKFGVGDKVTVIGREGMTLIIEDSTGS